MQRKIGLALFLAAGILCFLPFLTYVPAGELALRTGLGSGDPTEFLPPGFHLRIPLLQRIQRFSSRVQRLTLEVPVQLEDGIRLILPCEATARIDPDQVNEWIGAGSATAVPDRIRAAVTGSLPEWGVFLDRSILLLKGLEPEMAGLLEEKLSGRGLADSRVRCGPAAPEGGEKPDRFPEIRREAGSVATGVRILLIGLDGADWRIISPLIEQGALPNLAGLLGRGIGGNLRSFQPMLSPLLWTTVVTGVSPDLHGILDFLVTDPGSGSPVPIPGTYRQAKAIWNLATEYSRSADFVGWWATWPAERIDGTMVSDRVSYSLFQAPLSGREMEASISPAADYRELISLVVGADSIPYHEIRQFVDIPRPEYREALDQLASPAGGSYRNPVSHLLKILAAAKSYHRIALKLLARDQPEIFGVYYQGIDEVSHRFAHYMPPRMDMVSRDDYLKYRDAVERFYLFQDEMIGELLEAVSTDTLVMVLSDHGFKSGGDRPEGLPPDIEGKPDRWHRPQGILVMSGGPVQEGSGALSGDGPASPELKGATLYDIAPTLLYLAGLPISGEMPGIPLFAALDPAFLKRTAVYMVDSYGRMPERTSPSPQGSAVEEEMLARLRSLGYIAGDRPGQGGEVPAAGTGMATYHANRAYLKLSSGDRGGAGVEIDRALSLKSDYLPALVLKAQILEEIGDFPGALAVARTVLQEEVRQGDRQPGTFLQMARLFEASGRPEAGLAEFLGYLEMGGGDPELYLAIGALHLAVGNGPAAAERYREAVALQPANEEAVRRLFFMLLEQQKFSEAEQLVRDATTRAPDSIVHLNLQGLLFQELGDFQAAEGSFLRARSLEPEDVPTMSNLGGLYGSTGRLEDAVELLREACEIDPDSEDALVNLAAALGRLNQLPEVIFRLEFAKSRGIDSPGIRNALGVAYFQTGRKDDARESFLGSLKINPDQPEVRRILGNIRGNE